jgi:putative 2OG-Fe(II) oxygenase
MNLALLLSDNPRGVGATAFLPRSHKLPRWASRISWSNVSVASPWLTPFKGELGTTGFFFNRTWHARLKNGSSSVHDVILMGFFAAGGTYTPYEPSKEDLARWHGWELGRLLDPSVGTRSAQDGRVLVLAADGTEGGSSYAMSLEKGEWEDRDWRVLLLRVKVLLLEAGFRPLRLMRRRINALLSIRSQKT